MLSGDTMLSNCFITFLKGVYSFLLKRGLLYKERICSQREQILSLEKRHIFRAWHEAMLTGSHKSGLPWQK